MTNPHDISQESLIWALKAINTIRAMALGDLLAAKDIFNGRQVADPTTTEEYDQASQEIKIVVQALETIAQAHAEKEQPTQNLADTMYDPDGSRIDEHERDDKGRVPIGTPS